MTSVSYQTVIVGDTNAAGTTKDFFTPSTASLVVAAIGLKEETALPIGVSSVSYAGASMTRISDTSASNLYKRLEMWYQEGAYSSATSSFQAIFTDQADVSYLGWFTIDSPVVGDPIRSADTENSSLDTFSRLTMSTGVNDIILDCVLTSGDGLAVGGSQSGYTVDNKYGFGASHLTGDSAEEWGDVVSWSWVNVDNVPIHSGVILYASGSAATVRTPQDSFTFADQGMAYYSDQVSVTDGTPGFDDAISTAVTESTGAKTIRTITDSFTYFGKALRDLVVDRGVTDSVIPTDQIVFTDEVESEITYGRWRRRYDVSKEDWDRKSDTTRESWSRFSDSTIEDWDRVD